MRALAAVLALACASPAGDVAFVGVAVVPMDGDRVLEGRTVLVRDGVVAAVGEEVAVPGGALRIDGRGRYLMPGLADMHVHNWYEEEHVLFLANGVTTVRNLWGAPMHVRWRREIEAGERLGPTIRTTGPIVDGAEPVWQEGAVVVTTPERAREVVADQKAAGYDAVKVYDRLSADAYAALAAAAREAGMRLEGHVPAAVGIGRALEAGQDSVEHLGGYPLANAETMAELAKRTAEAGTWSCVTLVVYAKRDPGPEMRYVPPRLRATWGPATVAEVPPPLRELAAMRGRAARTLHEATGRVLLGTDCGTPFIVAGWSVHEELALLVGAGLTPYEALSCGTRRAAEYLGEPSGVVAEGKRADLLLLDANPLEDVANAARIRGVMVRGRWLPREELDRMLETVAASYERPKERFREFPPLPEGEAFLFDVTWNGLVVGQERFCIDAEGVLHVQQVNDPPWDARETWTLRPGDDLDGVNAVATWARLHRRFRELAVGETRTLDYREGGRKVPLRATRESATVFLLRMEREDGATESRLTYDERGVPVELATRLQQGTVRFLRKTASG